MVTYNIRLNSHYGNTSCGVSRLGIQNLIVDFCLKMKCFKEFFHILLRRLNVAILSFSDIFKFLLIMDIWRIPEPSC